MHPHDGLNAVFKSYVTLAVSFARMQGLGAGSLVKFASVAGLAIASLHGGNFV